MVLTAIGLLQALYVHPRTLLLALPSLRGQNVVAKREAKERLSMASSSASST
jgi:hypothetical protein